MRLSLLLLSIIGLFDGAKGQIPGCSDECKLQDDMQNNPLVKCGKVIGEHPIYGKKCVYLTKTRLVQFAVRRKIRCPSQANHPRNRVSLKYDFRDKFPTMKGLCEGLQWNNNGTIVQTGALLTLNNAVENNATRDYINAMNSAESSTTVYFAYAYIGLRKTCRHCSWHWVDNEPLTYTNWWGTEPNTYYYECAHIRSVVSYNL